VTGTPAITFAIPYYSGIEYLRRAIASVQAQTRDDWECVVVDDAGPESAAAAVLALGDGRVRYERNPENLGLGGNWNRAIALATAPLVTLLHADDELLPGYADAVVRAHAAHPDALAVYTRAMVIGPDGDAVFSFPDRIKRVIEGRSDGVAVVQGEPGLERLLRGQFIFCPTLCYRRELLGPDPFSTEWRMVLDLALLAGSLLDGRRIVGLPDPLYAYRRHDASQTATLTASTERFDEELAVYDEIAGRAEAAGWYRAAATARTKRIIRLHLAYRILGDLLHGRREAARTKWRTLGRARQG
jgi:glycosyltransferase involved in cell wall biosynthesis